MTIAADTNKTVMPLDGEWEFREFPESSRRMRDLDTGGWKKAHVPSSIFGCLIEAGVIDAFMLRANPEDFDWVSEKSWIFRKTVELSPELTSKDRVHLVFDGLDTVGQVWCNEKLVGKTDNMFIAHTFDITDHVHAGRNVLMVKFSPAREEAARRMLRYGKLSEHHFGDPCRTYLRKAQFQFGSVLGPSLPGCGIFRSVRLEAVRTAEIEAVYVRTIDCSEHSADIRVAIDCKRFSTDAPLLCRLDISGGGLNVHHELPLAADETQATAILRIDRPILWWPAGYGVPHLYHLSVRLLTAAGECLDVSARDFGIRMLRVNRSADQHGHAFGFEINGQPVAVRGANWVPPSVGCAGDVQDGGSLLLKCADSHINMLRVWGGGCYEEDRFYAECDRLGILVWQDFMFASAYYPDRQWFREAVEQEARAVIRRLRSYACLALWCGNSRIDQLHDEGKLGSGRKFYGKGLYHDLLPGLLSELDPDHDYIPTTPFAEAGSRDHNDPNSGTTHNWQLWNHYATAAEQVQQRPVPRFVAEFGVQSLPAAETLRTFIRPRDLNLGAISLEKHAYQPGSVSRLAGYAAELFAPPRDLEEQVWQSQVVQARLLKTYIEHLRAMRPQNAGVLFWTVNDSGPAIGFSMIDYLQRPKAAAFYARRFYAPVLVTLTEPAPGSPFKAVVVNDSRHRITATLCCRLLDFGGHCLDEIRIPVTASPFSVSTPGSLPRSFRYPPAWRQSFLHLSLDDEQRTLAENTFFFCPDKHAVWPAAEIDLTITATGPVTWKVALESNTVVRDLLIVPPAPADCSDNFLTLLPGETRTVFIEYKKTGASPRTPLKLYCSNYQTGD
jgi:beta-mannosidase